jgi:hypothetical protein
MAEWLEDHVAAIGSLNSNFGTFGRASLKWRPSGVLKWKVEIVGWEGWGVVFAKLAPPRL